MAINKVIYDGRTLVDLSSDTVDADYMMSGYTAHKRDGTSVTGNIANGDPLEYGNTAVPMTGVAVVGTAQI